MKGTPIRYSLPLLALLFWACSDESTGPSAGQVVLSAGSAAIVVGDTTRLQATVDGAGGPGSAVGVRWTSLDPEIATIDRSGLVTGVTRGTVRITAEVGGTRDTARVHVVPRQYNVQSQQACTSPDYRTGRVVAVGEHSIVLADTANPSGGFSAAEYREVAETFDKVIYPVITKAFGEPADIDGNERVLIFYTRAVNELTPPGSQGFVGGFFFARDLFPRSGSTGMQTCAGSNEAEMFYLMAPDPNGVVNGNKRDKNRVLESTLGTIAHEFQHLINASRRVYVNNAPAWEDTWLNEGLSHIAEELMFYHVSGLSPRQNINVDRIRGTARGVDAFNAYQVSNIGRLSAYFDEPELHSGFSNEARLGDRGAVWHFLRYIADQVALDDRELWFRLANTRSNGLANLEAAIGQDPLPLYRRWAITAYTDDLVATVDPSFQQPSWNYRSIIPVINTALPKATRLRPATTESILLHAGGSAYLEFSIPAEQRAEIQVNSQESGAVTSGACVEESPPLALDVGEVFTPAAGEGSPFCLDGGASGGTYVVVATSMAMDTTKSAITVTGFGIAEPPAANTLLAASGSLEPATWPLRRDAVEPVLDYSLHASLRRQEMALLAPAGVSEAARPMPRALLQQDPGTGTAADLHLALVRVR